jgi:hypothetical protein
MKSIERIVGKRTVALLLVIVSAGIAACRGDDQPIGSPPEDASSDARAVEAGASERVLVATGSTDFSSTEVATIDLASGSVLSSSTYPDGDAIPRTSEGRSFVLERTFDRLNVLDSSGVRMRTIELGQDGGATQNPHDIAIVPGTSTAFVPLYNSGRVAVVDVDAGTVTSIIDLSGFADANDGDHSPDIDSATFVPSTGLVYFALQRIDTTKGFPIPCPDVPSLIVAVDPATQGVVAGDAGTSVMKLSFVSPSSVAYDASSGRLFVLSNGCTVTAPDGGMTRARQGIEAITLATGQQQVLYAPTSADYLSSLVLLGPGAALVNSFDAGFNALWNRWDLASPALGAALANVPGSAIRESGDTLLGIQGASTADGAQAGYDVLRYRVSNDETSVAASNPNAAPYGFVSGLALAP